ncbi:MAG: YgiT-type zinc finger protein [Candidatus Binatia bacterium]
MPINRLASRAMTIHAEEEMDDDRLVIEGVPVNACSQCGESYLTAETQHEIERMRGRQRRARTI